MQQQQSFDDDDDASTARRVVKIAALYDKTGYPWAEELIDFTVSLINNHNDGWFDNILDDGTELVYSISDAACDEDVAVREYLKLTDGSTMMPHAIMGCRCSDPTLFISTLAAVQDIPVLSPSASNPKLSIKDDYPTFNRVIGPDNSAGQVGALVSLLRDFNFTRISIINTNTQYATDLKVELTRLWQGEHDGVDPFVGEIGYVGTVKVDSKDENSVERSSVVEVLKNVPVHDPSINSRVVVLLGHNQHVFPILKAAQSMDFQPDTIFVGLDAWTGRHPLDGDTSFMPPVPGYIGLVPFRNPASPVHQEFLARLQHGQEGKSNSKPSTEHIAADRVIDSMLALAMALSNVPHEHRRDGRAVVEALRGLSFEGLSGLVEFNDKGDRANPQYSVMTLPRAGEDWVTIGTAAPGQVNIDKSKICYAEIGCVNYIPSDIYPSPTQVGVTIVVVVLGVAVAILVPLACCFYRQRLSVKQRLKLLEEEIKGIDSDASVARQRKVKLYKDFATLLGQPRPSSWTEEEQGLVSIPPTEKEYWTVLEKMRETMNDNETCHISELSRVQNDGIWSYYVFRKNQMANKYGIEKLKDATKTLREIECWHGTSSLNPDVIYKDRQDGFMMQFSQEGLYGRGLYFAERFGYSDCYSYRVDATRPGETEGQEDREIFLVKLLVGQTKEMNHLDNEYLCRSLVAPPENPDTEGLKYDAVSGVVGDGSDQTKIHVVFDNGRAFPSYLIRYYKGPRDPSRTKFESYEEAVADMKKKKKNVPAYPQVVVDMPLNRTSRTDSGSLDGDYDPTEQALDAVPFGAAEDSDDCAVGIPVEDDDQPVDIEAGAGVPNEEDESIHLEITEAGQDAIWMYENDEGQPTPYGEDLQSVLEDSFRRDSQASITIEHHPWTYEVDMDLMVQTNLQHPNKRQRRISRLSLSG